MKFILNQRLHRIQHRPVNVIQQIQRRQQNQRRARIEFISAHKLSEYNTAQSAKPLLDVMTWYDDELVRCVILSAAVLQAERRISRVLHQLFKLTPTVTTVAWNYPRTHDPAFPSRGHRATTVVEIPPRGRNSPFTSAHTGFAHRTTSSKTRFTTFS